MRTLKCVAEGNPGATYYWTKGATSREVRVKGREVRWEWDWRKELSPTLLHVIRLTLRGFGFSFIFKLAPLVDSSGICCLLIGLKIIFHFPPKIAVDMFIHPYIRTC